MQRKKKIERLRDGHQLIYYGSELEEQQNNIMYECSFCR